MTEDEFRRFFAAQVVNHVREHAPRAPPWDEDDMLGSTASPAFVGVFTYLIQAYLAVAKEKNRQQPPQPAPSAQRPQSEARVDAIGHLPSRNRDRDNGSIRAARGNASGGRLAGPQAPFSESNVGGQDSRAMAPRRQPLTSAATSGGGRSTQSRTNVTASAATDTARGSGGRVTSGGGNTRKGDQFHGSGGGKRAGLTINPPTTAPDSSLETRYAELSAQYATLPLLLACTLMCSRVGHSCPWIHA